MEMYATNTNKLNGPALDRQERTGRAIVGALGAAVVALTAYFAPAITPGAMARTIARGSAALCPMVWLRKLHPGIAVDADLPFTCSLDD